jgi:hypothetical protein
MVVEIEWYVVDVGVVGDIVVLVMPVECVLVVEHDEVVMFALRSLMCVWEMAWNLQHVGDGGSDGL